MRTGTLILALAALLGPGLGLSPPARASLTLNISSASGANLEFKGSGTKATLQFNNNSSGQGFSVRSSSGIGDSIGLRGTIGGTFSYTKASIGVHGLMQTASLTTTGGTFKITDAHGVSLTA